MEKPRINQNPLPQYKGKGFSLSRKFVLEIEILNIHNTVYNKSIQDTMLKKRKNNKITAIILRNIKI